MSAGPSCTISTATARTTTATQFFSNDTTKIPIRISAAFLQLLLVLLLLLFLNIAAVIVTCITTSSSNGNCIICTATTIITTSSTVSTNRVGTAT